MLPNTSQKLTSSLCASCYFLATLVFANSVTLGQQSTKPIVGPDVVFEEKDGMLAVEAEHFAKQTDHKVRAWHMHSTIKTADVKPDGDPAHVKDASGSAYLESLPDTRRTHDDKLIKGENFSNEPGKMAILHYQVWVNSPGRYYVWVRAYSTGTEDNGIHVGLDGKWPESGRRLQWTAKQKWFWDSKQRTAKVHTGVPGMIFLDIEKKGPHTISFSMREDGFEFDKWLMTKQKNMKRPADHGPPTQLRKGVLPKPFPPVSLNKNKNPASQLPIKKSARNETSGIDLEQGEIECGPEHSTNESETLPAWSALKPIDSFEKMWKGFDPQKEPLQIEILQEWTEQGVKFRIVRFRVGIFKGKVARLAAIYGFPATAEKKKVPGLVQIHGGGQYADYKACLANAKRGYATVSIAWAGRISAPSYRVTPAEVKLFWDNKTNNPKYKVTTDWGAVDGYHAPSRNQGNVFPSAKAGDWTIDPEESPRNSGWFLCALAARRAITFLEQQPEVDKQCLGVYGHSMGGKLTVLSSIDSRVKAAAPSCGGISDRYNRSQLFNKTLGDQESLKNISCPTVFLSPANDFHGRIGDLPDAIQDLKSKDWRVTCSPHHNHQDTSQYEVATMLWFDQHLKGSFEFPKTPQTQINLKSKNGTPDFIVSVDDSKPILNVDVFYTQHGKHKELPSDIENTKQRFWHFAKAVKENGKWHAKLPLATIQRPLWVYANVTYRLDNPVSGVGYYYGAYTAESYCVSSVLTQVAPNDLQKASVRTQLKPTDIIEDFQENWQKQWFTYRPQEWPIMTNKLHSEVWKASTGAKLTLQVRSENKNDLLVRLDDHIAVVNLNGGEQWQKVTLEPNDFKDYSNQARSDFKNVKLLKLAFVETVRPPRGIKGKAKRVGKFWNGAAPEFKSLRWQY